MAQCGSEAEQRTGGDWPAMVLARGDWLCSRRGVRKRAPLRAAVPAGLRRDAGRLPTLPALAPGAAARSVSRQGSGAERCYLRLGAEAAQHPPQRAAPLT